MPSAIDTLAPVAGITVTLSEGCLVTLDRPDSLNSVYPAEDFEAEVGKVLSKLVAGPAVAYAKTKDAINATTLTELDPALEREFRGQSVLLRSHDFIEGATAFQQRRTANFTDG